MSGHTWHLSSRFTGLWICNAYPGTRERVWVWGLVSRPGVESPRPFFIRLCARDRITESLTCKMGMVECSLHRTIERIRNNTCKVPVFK